MNISTAFNIFVRQALRDRAIPFQIHLGNPKHETIAAMLEAVRIAKDPSVPSYKTAHEAFAAALSEEDWCHATRSNIPPSFANNLRLLKARKTTL